MLSEYFHHRVYAGPADRALRQPIVLPAARTEAHVTAGEDEGRALVLKADAAELRLELLLSVGVGLLGGYAKELFTALSNRQQARIDGGLQLLKDRLRRRW